MQPEMKCPLGIAEAEALAKWLEQLYPHIKAFAVMQTNEKEFYLYEGLAAEAREWAERVRPVPVKRRG